MYAMHLLELKKKTGDDPEGESNLRYFDWIRICVTRGA